LRPPSLRAELLKAARSERAERARVLGALLSLASCPHVDVALAASELVTALCHEGSAEFGRTLDTHDRCQAISALAGLVGLSTHREDNSMLEMHDNGKGLKLRRYAACRMLRELVQTNAFRKEVRARVQSASMIREAKAAVHEQDGRLVMMILLLGFECWECLPMADRRELLLLARSQTVVDLWAEIMASSKDSQSLYECLSTACNLLSISKTQDACLAGSTLGQVTTALPAWIEVQTLVETLAANHRSREHELESFQLQFGEVEAERTREKLQAAQERIDYEAERQQEADEHLAERRRLLQELQDSAFQLAEARRRGDELGSAVARDSATLAQMRGKCEAAERHLEDAEITHADLLQRSLKAENLCRQLTARLEEKDAQLLRANEDREGLLGEVQRRQRAEYGLAEMTETVRRMEAEIAELGQEKLGLQRESAGLVEARERLQGELRMARADSEESRVEGQRRAALLDARAEDLGRRLASSTAATQAAEMARDDTLREASWLRCEVATFQRFERDRENNRSSPGLEPDAWRQSATSVEQRLRDRAEQAHSNALEVKSRGHVRP